MGDWLDSESELVQAQKSEIFGFLSNNKRKQYSHTARVALAKQDLSYQDTHSTTKQQPARQANSAESPYTENSHKREWITDEEGLMTNKFDEPDDQLEALKKLRDLPRNTQVDSRIAAIKDLLDEKALYKTLKMLRWPQGVVCPRCRSTNVVRREPPPDAPDLRHYYVCLNCKGEGGGHSGFDDLTGLPVDSIKALRQWILCWYLIGFCSLNQIAKILGLSISEVLALAAIGTEITELPEKDLEHASGMLLTKTRKQKDTAAKAEEISQQEESTRSESRAPLKPGYKSKK